MSSVRERLDQINGYSLEIGRPFCLYKLAACRPVEQYVTIQQTEWRTTDHTHTRHSFTKHVNAR